MRAATAPHLLSPRGRPPGWLFYCARYTATIRASVVQPREWRELMWRVCFDMLDRGGGGYVGSLAGLVNLSVLGELGI